MMKRNIFSQAPGLIAFAAILASLVLYFAGARPLIGAGTAFQVEVVILAFLVAVTAGTLMFLVISLLALIFVQNRASWKKKLGGQMIFLTVILILLVVFILGSQLTAHTPAITGPDGKPLAGSIASLEKVRLGGADQWIIVRGHDVNKPVLLFLSGGPGASEASRVLRFNQELEKHFVVVIWEQRGCGKSYPSHVPASKLTLDQYVADLVELTDQLRARFDEQKIILVGHSWGTIIGLRAAQARPDLYYAYVGTAQMVNVLETDQMIYDMMIDYSRKTGDTQFVATLEKQGPPPYYGKNPVGPYATLFGREYTTFEVPHIKNEAYRREGDLFLLMLKQPEYGWLDRVYYLLGLMNTFNVVYPQLQTLDFRLDAVQLDLPVYIFLGRHDMNNPSILPEDYFNRLQAPYKQLVYFEDSGHGMIWQEADLYHDLMIHTIVPQTVH